MRALRLTNDKAICYKGKVTQRAKTHSLFQRHWNINKFHMDLKR